jgi:hypothetical protein
VTWQWLCKTAHTKRRPMPSLLHHPVLKTLVSLYHSNIHKSKSSVISSLLGSPPMLFQSSKVITDVVQRQLDPLIWRLSMFPQVSPDYNWRRLDKSHRFLQHLERSAGSIRGMDTIIRKHGSHADDSLLLPSRQFDCAWPKQSQYSLQYREPYVLRWWSKCK